MLKTAIKPKSSPNKVIQRKPFFSKDDNENFTSSSKENGFFSTGRVQAKLLVEKSNDRYETEADNVATDVVDRIGDNSSESKSIQGNITSNIIQKQAMDDESDATETAVETSADGGAQMNSETQSSMEEGFGADFGGVNIHTGQEATSMNQSLNSRAFTSGSDIYFNEGEYNTETRDGKHLLAHELTHTIQQGASPQHETKDKNESEVEEKNKDAAEVGKENVTKSQELLTDKEGASTSEQKDSIEAKDPKEKEKDANSAIDKTAAEKPGKKKGKGKKKQKLSLSTFVGESKKEEAAGGGGGGGAGGGAARVTDMSNPSLDGGPERMETKTEESIGEVDKELKTTSQSVYQKGINKSKELSAAEKEKENPGTKLKNVEASVEIKTEEKQSEVNNKQVQKVDAAKEPVVKEDKASEELKDKIEKSMPKTLKDAMKFASRGKGKKIGRAVGNIVEGDVKAVESTYQEVENTEAPEAPPSSEALNEIEVAKETPAMNLGNGLVPPTSKKQTDLSEYDKESDNLLEKEGLPEEQLEMVDSGDLAEGNKLRKELKKNKTEEPAKIKAFEQQQRIETKAKLEKDEKKSKDTMRSKRTKELQGSKNEQRNAKSALEKKREEVTKKINNIYKSANKTVKEKLKNLKKDSLAAFDKEEIKSSKEFESSVKSRLKAFKRRRYGGRWGGAKWLKDKVLGMDDLPEVKEIFDSEKKSFENKIDAAIKTITKANKKVIKECKTLIAKAKIDIATYVKGLGPALRKTGLEAQKKMKEKLDKLDKEVNAAEKELNKKLQRRREAAIKAIEQKIEKMKKEMSGIVGKLGSLFLDGLIKFFKWALEKAGYSPNQLMGVINKGKAVITKIVKDPKAFFRNLGTAVGNGIKNFVKNIKSWMIKGFISWLTGAMDGSGLILPDKFDTKGIFSLALQAMGLTWSFIRSRLVKHVPEKVIAAAEKGLDIVKRIIKEGPIAIWHMIKEKAAEVKKSIMEGIRNWVIMQVVKSATIKIISMLNPVGAIVQAIIAVYKVVMFFIENWDRIVQFVKTVFNSIVDIAMGNLGKAAKMVENALGMTIPIILSFLARFLGLSGIGKAIRNIIAKIRAPVVKVVDKAAKFIGKKIRKWFGNKKVKKDPAHSPATQKKIQQGIAALKTEEKKLAKNKKISREDAEKVAKKIRGKFKVFKSLRIIDGKDSWDYKYTASTGATIDTPIQKSDDGKGRNTKPTYSGTQHEFGKSAKVKYLAKGHGQGSEANSGLFNSHYEYLNKRLHPGGNARFYIRGHLLNNNLGGPGSDWKNLTPLKGKKNGEHLRRFEKYAKAAVTKEKQIRNFEVTAFYGRGAHPKEQDLINGKIDFPELENKNFSAKELGEVIRSEKYVPTRLVCKADIVNDDNSVKAAAPSNPVYINQSNSDLSYGNIGAYKLGNISRRERYSLKAEFDKSNGNKAAFTTQTKNNLNGINNGIASSLFDHYSQNNTISGHRWKQVMGVSKASLEKQNPNKKIVG